MHGGDPAGYIQHLEAAVDMGRRAGALVAVQGALMNLASVDIYLGRYERASASVESLVAQKEELSAAFRADLLGHQADLAARAARYPLRAVPDLPRAQPASDPAPKPSC